MDGFRIYRRYIAISFRAQMQYRASFIMLSVGLFLVCGSEFFGIAVLFDRFKQLLDWRLEEVAFFYGLVNMSFALADATSRGFDLFSGTVKSGDFDRLLLRPRSTALQLAAQELTLRRIGRFSLALCVFLWASTSLGLEWSLGSVLFLLATMLGCACLLYGLIVLQATLCFWTTEGLEVMNSLTYGGVETTQYPLTIYRTWFRRFFTYVVPLACVTYFPSIALLERTDELGSSRLFQYTAPAVGFLFLALSLQVWKFGVRHYRSTGS